MEPTKGAAEKVDGGLKTNEVDVRVVSPPEGLADATTEAGKPPFFSRQILTLFGFSCVGFCCNTMYGFDASLMASLLVFPSFQDEFGVDVAGAKSGYVTALLQIGSVCAIPFIGVVLDKLGRRGGMFIGALSAILGVILQGTAASSHSLPQYLAGRFFLGWGAAMATSAAPTYVLEISHPSFRGLMTGMVNCSYDIGGILVSGVSRAAKNYSGSTQWVMPTWVQLIFSGTVLLCVFFIPESPRWHFSHGKRDKAIEFLTRYHGGGDLTNPVVQLEIAEFESGVESDRNASMRWWDFRSAVRSRSDAVRLVNCLTLAIYSAWSTGGIGNYMAKVQCD